LCDSEPVKLVIPAGSLLDAPLNETPGNAGGQRVESDAQPFGGDRAEAAVKIGDDAVEVYAENKGAVSHSREVVK
jgi:hypothetical protein